MEKEGFDPLAQCSQTKQEFFAKQNQQDSLRSAQLGHILQTRLHQTVQQTCGCYTIPVLFFFVFFFTASMCFSE